MRGLRSIALLGSVIGQASAEAIEVEIVDDRHDLPSVDLHHLDQPVTPGMTARQERQMNKTRKRKKKAFRR